MKSTPRRIAFHILIFVIVLVVLSAVAIWLGLGPVVHSEIGLTAGIANYPADHVLAGISRQSSWRILRAGSRCIVEESANVRAWPLENTRISVWHLL